MRNHFYFQELKKVMALMGKRKWWFYLSLFLTSLTCVTLIVINSLMYKNVVNGVLLDEESFLRVALIFLCAVILLVCGVTPLTSYLSMYISNKTMLELRSRLYGHLLHLPRTFFFQHVSGDLLSRLSHDLNQVKRIYDGTLYSLLFVIMSGLVSLTTVILLDWRLAVIITVLGLFSYWLNLRYARPLRIISQRVQRALGRTSQSFLDLIAGNRVIKLFNIQRVLLNHFALENNQLLEEKMQVTKIDAQRESANYLLSGLSFLSIVGIGTMMVSRGMVDLGTVMAIFLLKTPVDELFTKSGKELAELQKYLAGVDRVFDVLERSEETLAEEHYQWLESEKEQLMLDLKDIHFRYGEGQEVLSGLNLQVRKNETVALVGTSGAGKSTIIKLLLGLYAPQKGTIGIGGERQGEMSLKDLRSQFTYVGQDAQLFAGTIEANIRHGDMEADFADLVSVARMVNVHEIIDQLPAGYQTQIGEKGTKLSGGQRQRIAMARALVKDAPILLLDEATSALDSQTEYLIQTAMERLVRGRTTIIIAHRLSTIIQADRVFLIDDGQVAAQGTHTELLTRCKKYQSLFATDYERKEGVQPHNF